MDVVNVFDGKYGQLQCYHIYSEAIILRGMSYGNPDTFLSGHLEIRKNMSTLTFCLSIGYGISKTKNARLELLSTSMNAFEEGLVMYENGSLDVMYCDL